jgi:hypothetical protein
MTTEHDDMEELDIVAVGLIRPVTLQTIDPSKPTEVLSHKLELFEMSGDVQEKFMNLHRRRMQRDDSGNVVGVKDFEGMRAELLTRCLRFAESGELVTEKWMKEHRIPGSTMNTLYQAAMKLNKISASKEDEEDDAGEE